MKTFEKYEKDLAAIKTIKTRNKLKDAKTGLFLFFSSLKMLINSFTFLTISKYIFKVPLNEQLDA